MFSIRLKNLRKKKGLSQQDMADYLGITRQGYGKYESGTSETDNKTLVKLADFFEVTTDYLLGKSDKPHQTEDDVIESIKERIATEFPDADLMFNDLANMTAEQLEEVYEFIKFKRSQSK